MRGRHVGDPMLLSQEPLKVFIGQEDATLAADNLYLAQGYVGMQSTMPPPGLLPPDAPPGVFAPPVAPPGVFATPPPSRSGSKTAVPQKSTHARKISSASDSTTCSTAEGETDSQEETSSDKSSKPAHLHTTVMMRNLPNDVDRDEVLQIMNDKGFEGRYNLVYLPMDFTSGAGLGYAFINFKENKDAESFFEYFQGFNKWNLASGKVCDVSWSTALQGLEAHVNKFRNSPVMHESVPDKFKPIIFKNGERVPFPRPSKKVRAPRVWPRRPC